MQRRERERQRELYIVANKSLTAAKLACKKLLMSLNVLVILPQLTQITMGSMGTFGGNQREKNRGINIYKVKQYFEC